MKKQKIKNNKILLAIDVGNTNITCGIFIADRMTKRFELPTRAQKTAGIFKKNIKKYANVKNIDTAIMSSVVPKITEIIKQSLGKKILVLGKNITAPIKNLYKNPSQVGQDRLVNSYAAIRLYGSPAIIIDTGTAITFDVVSKKGQYLGGIILPGLDISAKAMNMYTALLPKIKINSPKTLIGKSTRDSMLSGLFFGFGSSCSGLLSMLKKKIGKNAKVIGTGGAVKTLKRYCSSIDIIDQDLTLKGLMLIYKLQTANF